MRAIAAVIDSHAPYPSKGESDWTRKPIALMVAAILLSSGLLTMSNAQSNDPSRPNNPIVLWPNGAPGAVGSLPEDVPTLTPYWAAKDKATGAAVIVCPGGGYSHLAEHEGRPVAEWFASLGITAFVLKYRLGPRYHHPAPLQDAARAIRMLRSHATEWQIDPKRIGILGFSAGGHVASTIGTHFDAGNANDPDPIERVSSRPDAMMLIYAVITMRAGTHGGSKKLLIGENAPEALVALLSNEEQVTKQTPPAFLVHAATDPAVPVENSLHFAEAMKKAGAPFELHVYERGPHGFGLGRQRSDFVYVARAMRRLVAVARISREIRMAVVSFALLMRITSRISTPREKANNLLSRDQP